MFPTPTKLNPDGTTTEPEVERVYTLDELRDFATRYAEYGQGDDQPCAPMIRSVIYILEGGKVTSLYGKIFSATEEGLRLMADVLIREPDAGCGNLLLEEVRRIQTRNPTGRPE